MVISEHRKYKYQIAKDFGAFVKGTPFLERYIDNDLVAIEAYSWLSIQRNISAVLTIPVNEIKQFERDGYVERIIEPTFSKSEMIDFAKKAPQIMKNDSGDIPTYEEALEYWNLTKEIQFTKDTKHE